ncbi:MAG TPA: hypothetical protein VG248_06390 [Caulobacteraceae bacterium]|nr:hypothetical protein [Caulobacteraceae bacterium]
MRSLRAFWATLLIAVAFAAGACLLPDNPYQRWQLLDGTIHANARWFYERAHFDPRPIDVVFVGPSRVEMGVDAPRLEQDLAKLGRPAHVMNAALPQEGRNLNDVIVREILSAKTPRLIVIGVTEKPSRFGHPAYKYIAPADQVLDPGYFPDFDWASDVAYLPYRQLRLFVSQLLPGGTGLDRQFDPRKYAGESVETTGSLLMADGRFKDADHPGSPSIVRAAASRFAASMHPPLLHGRVARWEFADERANIADIARLARSRGVRIAFLYLPYFNARPQIQEAPFYSRFGPIWRPDFLADDIGLYYDYGHLDRTGAARLTDWLAPQVAAQLAEAPVGAPESAKRQPLFGRRV